MAATEQIETGRRQKMTKKKQFSFPISFTDFNGTLQVEMMVRLAGCHSIFPCCRFFFSVFGYWVIFIASFSYSFFLWHFFAFFFVCLCSDNFSHGREKFQFHMLVQSRPDQFGVMKDMKNCIERKFNSLRCLNNILCFGLAVCVLSLHSVRMAKESEKMRYSPHNPIYSAPTMRTIHINFVFRRCFSAQ